MFQDFSSFTHTQKTHCILIHHFHLLYFCPFIYIYLYPFMSSHVKYTQTKNDVIYLQSFDDTCLSLTYIVVSSNPNLYELATTKEGKLAFYIKWQRHYNFDVKVRCCGFVDFVNDVIDYGCLGYVFCFRIKEIQKDTFYINFYSMIFL